MLKRIVLVVLLTASLGFISIGESYQATAYALRGRTASGIMVRRGIVAADPRLHRLGSKVRITGAGKYSGVYLVADTGGKIKRNRIDIWMPSSSEAKRWGRRRVFVSKI